jgi:hypothetical protein
MLHFKTADRVLGVHGFVLSVFVRALSEGDGLHKVDRQHSLAEFLCVSTTQYWIAKQVLVLRCRSSIETVSHQTFAQQFPWPRRLNHVKCRFQFPSRCRKRIDRMPRDRMSQSQVHNKDVCNAPSAYSRNDPESMWISGSSITNATTSAPSICVGAVFMFSDRTAGITGPPRLMFQLKTRCRLLRVHAFVIRTHVGIAMQSESKQP